MKNLRNLALGSLFLLAISGCTTLSTPFRQAEIDGEKLFGSLLMPVSSDKENVLCFSFYFRPAGDHKNYFHTYILSAGHCPALKHTATLLVNTPEQGWEAVRPSVFVFNNRIKERGSLDDFFIGYIAEHRASPLYFTIDELRPTPDQDEYVITVAEPARLRATPTLQKIQFKRIRDDGVLIFEAEHDIQNGFSGAPVVTNTGRLLGILIGAEVADLKRYVVMPIMVIMQAYRRYLN